MTAFGATRVDHSDCFQVYSPGGSGILNITKTCFKAYTDAEATALYGGNFLGSAGFFYADDFQGQINLTDCVFWGGRTGLQVHADVGVTTLRLNNVYFVPSADPWAGGGRIIFLVPTVGASLVIAEWNNVREATIVNGVLVPGALIPEPTGTRITNSTGGSSSDPGLFNAQTATFSIEWDAVPNDPRLMLSQGFRMERLRRFRVSLVVFGSIRQAQSTPAMAVPMLPRTRGRTHLVLPITVR
jgi:hypothetical protein